MSFTPTDEPITAINGPMSGRSSAVLVGGQMVLFRQGLTVPNTNPGFGTLGRPVGDGAAEPPLAALVLDHGVHQMLCAELRP